MKKIEILVGLHGKKFGFKKILAARFSDEIWSKFVAVRNFWFQYSLCPPQVTVKCLHHNHNLDTMFKISHTYKPLTHIIPRFMGLCRLRLLLLNSLSIINTKECRNEYNLVNPLANTYTHTHMHAPTPTHSKI